MDSDRNLTGTGGEVASGRNEQGELHRYTIGEDESPSEAVTYALMDGGDGDAPPLEQQQPLYEIIDPDALDNLFGMNRDFENEDPSGRVTFTYEGYDVTVRADGEIVLRDAE